MQKQELFYEGKDKKVYKTENSEQFIISYKNNATANNKITNRLMQLLEKEGIATHFIKELSDTETLVRKVSIIPLEVLVRNIAAGSLAKRIGVEEGTRMKYTVLEYCYKDDTLGDPMVNVSHVLAMGWATREEIDIITDYAYKIGEFLTAYLEEVDIELIDIKLEFGRTRDGQIVLADEISPDTCRFWDSKSLKKLDRARFRDNPDGAGDAYQEVLKRLLGD